MKGFKKDGKFRPTEKQNQSGLSKSDMRKKETIGVNEANSLLRTKASMQDSHVKEFTEKEIDYEYDRFLFGMNDRGTGDIANAVRKAHEVDIGGYALSDLIREWADDTDTPIEDVDENYVIYDHIMNQAGSVIEGATGYDVRDDWEVYPNHLATSYNPHGDEDKLAEVLNNLPKDQKEALLQNKFVKSFVEDTDVSLNI